MSHLNPELNGRHRCEVLVHNQVNRLKQKDIATGNFFLLQFNFK